MEQQNQELSLSATNNETTALSVTEFSSQSLWIKRLRWFYVSLLVIILLLLLILSPFGLFSVVFGVIAFMVFDPDVITIVTSISLPLLLLISTDVSFSKSVTPLKKKVILLPIFYIFLLCIIMIFFKSVSEFEYLSKASLREKIKQYNIEVNKAVSSLEEDTDITSDKCSTFSISGGEKSIYGEGPCEGFNFFKKLNNRDQTFTSEPRLSSDDIAKVEETMQNIVSIRDKFFVESDNVPFIFNTRFYILVISENYYSQEGKRVIRRNENCHADKEVISCWGNIEGFSTSTLIRK